VVSERFEQARNFCNKLWNASRFCLMNLGGFVPGGVSDEQLTVEDRWVLSRLATVTDQVTESLETYHYAEASRALYDFAWDEFCSFYVEMVKGRLQDPATRAAAQRVLAHTLDTLLRLLHPTIPFITEEVWRLLNQVAPERGLAAGAQAAESIMLAPWPQVDAAHQDEEIERRFAMFEAVLGAVREIRARQNIAPKKPVKFHVRADDETCRLLQPMQPYFESMANATPVGWGKHTKPPAASATVTLPGVEVLVDLTGLIDVEAEIARNQQQEKKLLGLIQGKEKKLSNANFVDKAPPEVVQRERDSLVQLQEHLASVRAALEELS
jgi:valyl-tRNA synthetase